MGWAFFTNVVEEGSHLLIIQFLYTLEVVDGGTTFRLFKKVYHLNWKGLSTMLGFYDGCMIGIDLATHAFDRNEF